MTIVIIPFRQMLPNPLSTPVPIALMSLVAGELDQMNWDATSVNGLQSIFKQDPSVTDPLTHQNTPAVRLVQLGYLSVLTMAGGIGAPLIRRVSNQSGDIQVIWSSQWVTTFRLGVWDEDVSQFVADVNRHVLSPAYQGGGGGVLNRLQTRLRYYQGVLQELVGFYDAMGAGVDRGWDQPDMDPLFWGVVATHLPLAEINAIFTEANRHVPEPIFQPVNTPGMATLQLGMVLDLANQPEATNGVHLLRASILPRLKRCCESPQIAQSIRDSLAVEMGTIHGMAHFFKGVGCVLDRVIT